MIELQEITQLEYSLDPQMDIFKEKTKKDFEPFYKTYRPKLVFYNNKIVRDLLIAEDIATDSFLKSLKKIDDYDPEKAGFSTWLFTISRNECIQYLNKHRKLISMDKFIDEEGTTIKDFLKDDEEESLINKDLDNLNITKGKIIKNKIRYLKSPYKEVIKLREIEGKSYRDITIILRKENTISIDSTFFSNNNYDSTTNILTLVDPEKKRKDEVAKFYSINNIINDNDNNDIVNYEVIETDINNLISKIRLPKGNYNITGEIPFNMSTLKSQIKNGRSILKNMVKLEFEKLDKIHL